ncbi:NAD-dependent deacylase [Methylobacterium planeticum]|uniref:NAD-dependent protein deacylase n=1 Tax=Methylobacterium planeticum TaxID=2615211 RepID=A0A6N6MZ24_9HYPH|nr:NAD-dependent deacylase [Methylobacterium planeticum]KAB1075593.1 NAD-dependent deacylase [Methylobacterium planeticum]
MAANRPERIFVLTGAGISAESGLGTFRDRGGLWGRFDPMRLATPEAFADDPDTVLDFYNLRRRGVIAAEPHAGHRALAAAQARLAARGGRLFLCTQNVDDLHERAGARDVVHMHGELLRIRCLACGSAFDRRGDLHRTEPCAACGRAGALRPDVVWFGEMPKHLDRIDAALRAADLFVAIGTSGSVYPAAGYVAQARALGIRTCELNREPSDNAALFDEARYGLASDIVHELFHSRVD